MEPNTAAPVASKCSKKGVIIAVVVVVILVLIWIFAGSSSTAVAPTVETSATTTAQ